MAQLPRQSIRPALQGAELEAQMRRSFSRHPFEKIIIGSLWLCGTISLITTLLIIETLFEETVDFFREVSIFEFLFTANWQPLFEPEAFGIWELVAGTFNVLIWSLLMALPLGLAAAVYLSEYAHPRTRAILKPVLEALAGVPTVVYAFFALTVITTDILRPIFGDERVPIFNSLSASIVMAIMILPTIASVSEDAMSNVPRDLREAAYGLGSTRLEVAARVVFPAAISGVIAAVLLAIDARPHPQPPRQHPDDDRLHAPGGTGRRRARDHPVHIALRGRIDALHLHLHHQHRRDRHHQSLP
jgi:phosphate transport system permease protein